MLVKSMLIVLAMLISGCASSPLWRATHPVASYAEEAAARKKIEESLGENAIVYVYRNSLSMSARTSEIFVDGNLVADLNNKRYVAIELSPGAHVISQKWRSWIGDVDPISEQASLAITVVQGEKRYVTLDAGSAFGVNVVRFEWSFVEVAPDRGGAEISSLHKQ